MGKEDNFLSKQLYVCVFFTPINLSHYSVYKSIKVYEQTSYNIDVMLLLIVLIGVNWVVLALRIFILYTNP